MPCVQAAGQRMNTDARRAVFCAVMGAEDCMDAFERLLKLQLKVRIKLEGLLRIRVSSSQGSV